MASTGDRHGWHRGGQDRGQARPCQGRGMAGRGAGTAGTGDRAGDRHSRLSPPAGTPGDQPLALAPPGEGAQKRPQGGSVGPSPARAAATSKQCPRALAQSGDPLLRTGRVPAEAVLWVAVRHQRTLSLQVPLRLRGRLRSSRRADRSRRRDEVELRSPQLCRWMPSCGRSTPGQALQGTCNPVGTGCSRATSTPACGTPCSPTPQDSPCSRGSQAGTWGRTAGVARDGGGVRHVGTLSLRMGSFLSGPSGLHKVSSIP